MVEIVDERGRKQRYLLSEEYADDDYTRQEVADYGVDVGVPNLDQVDWEVAVTQLHNKLYDVGLFTMADVTAREGLLSAVILAVLKGKIVNLYSQGEH